VQSAHYGSVVCRPIRHGPNDVGLLLIAGLNRPLRDAGSSGGRIGGGGYGAHAGALLPGGSFV
jgi:hypothetical protein